MCVCLCHSVCEWTSAKIRLYQTAESACCRVTTDVPDLTQSDSNYITYICILYRMAVKQVDWTYNTGTWQVAHFYVTYRYLGSKTSFFKNIFCLIWVNMDNPLSSLGCEILSKPIWCWWCPYLPWHAKLRHADLNQMVRFRKWFMRFWFKWDVNPGVFGVTAACVTLHSAPGLCVSSVQQQVI